MYQKTGIKIYLQSLSSGEEESIHWVEMSSLLRVKQHHLKRHKNPSCKEFEGATYTHNQVKGFLERTSDLHRGLDGVGLVNIVQKSTDLEMPQCKRVTNYKGVYRLMVFALEWQKISAQGLEKSKEESGHAAVHELLFDDIHIDQVN